MEAHSHQCRNTQHLKEEENLSKMMGEHGGFPTRFFRNVLALCTMTCLKFHVMKPVENLKDWIMTEKPH